jgi:formate hydrogenlyase subunit 4
MYGVSETSEASQKLGRQVAIMILELGIWVIPMTLIFAPCRCLVLLVVKLQQLEVSIMHTRSSSPAIWSRISKDTNTEHDAVKEAWK